jgi:hypothetical protein
MERQPEPEPERDEANELKAKLLVMYNEVRQIQNRIRKIP